MTDTVAIIDAPDALTGGGLPDPATLSLDTVLHLQSLRRQLLDIQLQIRDIAGPAALLARTEVECLKCGYRWTPYNPFVPPLRCANCGCYTWNEPPTANSRKPTDPPARSFKQRKGRRRPKLRVWAEGSGSPFAPREVKAPPQASVPPPPSSVFVPPSVRSALPPPPSPSPVAPTESLSARFAAVLRDESPEQPERQASHAPTFDAATQTTLDAAKREIQEDGLLQTVEEAVNGGRDAPMEIYQDEMVMDDLRDQANQADRAEDAYWEPSDE